METVKLGDRNKTVSLLQEMLSKINYYTGIIDGYFWIKTDRAITRLQKDNKLRVDGIVGPATWRVLMGFSGDKEKKIFQLVKNKFVVFVDAGHGGMDDSSNYTTNGKYKDHRGLSMHKGSRYMEGVENRIVAERFITECAKNRITCIRTYHPYEDTPLSTRAKLVQAWLKRGYFGYMHSFHSNAISSSNSQKKMDITRGFSVYTTKGNNHSDAIADNHFLNTESEFPNWRMRKDTSDGDNDYEANFKVLRDTDTGHDFFGAILEEFGFHTSKLDATFITNESTRNRRARTACKTAIFARSYFNTLKLNS